MKEHIEGLTEKIDQALVRGINPQKSTLERAMSYALNVKGKRLRPLLFLTLLEAFQKPTDQYMNIACAIEYIHTYSLIHDDLPSMDNDDFRRGMPTVHKKFNDAIALLTGDTLLTHAFELITTTLISAEKTVNILRILTKCIGKDGMAGGQSLDLEFDGDKERIFVIHRMKTAELIKGALMAAAEIVDLSDDKKILLESAGVLIGIAFQMADDLLDIEGDETEVGKKLHKDKTNQSPNSVLFYGQDFIKREIESSYRHTVEILEQLHIDYPPFLFLMDKMVHRNK